MSFVYTTHTRPVDTQLHTEGVRQVVGKLLRLIAIQFFQMETNIK